MSNTLYEWRPVCHKTLMECGWQVMTALLMDFASKLWMSYRKCFAPLGKTYSTPKFLSASES